MRFSCFDLFNYDRVTQLVEYFLDMEEVVGSSPIVITTLYINLLF